MATVTGSITASLSVTPINSDLKFQNSFSGVTVNSVSGSVPDNAVFTGASLRFTSIAIWHTGTYFTLVYNSDKTVVLGQTEEASYQTAQFLRLNLDSYNVGGLLSAVTGNNLWLRFYGGNSAQNALNLRNSSVTLVLDYQYDDSSAYAASTGTLNKTTVEASGSNTIKLAISGQTNVLSHIINWNFGSYTIQSTVNVGSSEATITVPAAWCNAIPNATSGAATAELITYYGNQQIGSSKTYSFTVTVPTSIVPTLGTPSASILSSPVSSIYIQGNSKVRITSGTASGAYSSTIVSYTFSGSGLSTTGTASYADSGFIEDSGTRTYTVTVTDSRGRTASATCSIYVYPYSNPVISAYSAIRTTSAGVASETGTSILASCTCACSDLGSGQNTVTWEWNYKVRSASSWSAGNSGIASGTSNRKDSILSNDSSIRYQVQIIATDTLGSTATVTLDLLVPGVTVHLKSGGMGVGVGMKATRNGAAVEISADWDVYHGSYIVPTYVVQNSAPTGVTGLLWLKPVS